MILTQQKVEVDCIGELVVLSVGNVERSMEFHTAIRVAAEMREAARLIKRQCNDQSRRYRTAGSLHDASAPRLPVSKFNRTLPERVKDKDIDAGTDGFQVVLRVQNTYMAMPYDAALTISQWIRVRGKEARNHAGEAAHWSQFATETAQ
jgi:hypothetical protein